MGNILFRGKRIDNGEWVCGDLLNLHNGDKYIVNNKFGACIDDKGNFINTEYPFVCKVIPKTVGQFIGLFDCYDKPIYDKDIVEVYDGLYVVKKECDRLGGYWAETGWVLEQIGVDFIMCFSDTIDDFSNKLMVKVVGNVYDNKDLLERGIKQ